MKTPRLPGAKPLRVKKARVAVKKDDGPLVAFDATKVGRDYRQGDTYKVGERLEHATFGRGVVELMVGPKKMQVWFEGRDVLPSERRTLVHGRIGHATSITPAPLLERRRAVGGHAP